MSDDLYVICTTTRSRSVRQVLQAFDKTQDMSREVEVKLRFLSPEKKGNNAQLHKGNLSRWPTVESGWVWVE